jgi:O-glycosyl hydrolase
LQSNHPEVSCAALGNNNKGIYTLHMVNNGAERQATITGLPAKAQKVQMFVTNQQDAVKSAGIKTAGNGQLKIKLPARSFVTVVIEQ